jgi:serine/threonine protein kinase
MARLNHPNLISVYDSGHFDGMSYLVMEYVPGNSLRRSAHGVMVDPAEAVRIIRDVCSALAHAHENGVIHRDIKPANILLTPKAEPKIGDFGPARPPGSKAGDMPIGTPGYTAPEVCGHPELADHRSDIYAVGAVLYELVSGKAPEPAGKHLPALIDCPASLLPVCQRAMNPSPGLRHPDARALDAALEDWQSQHARQPASGPARRNVPPAATVPMARPPQTTQMYQVPRRPGRPPTATSRAHASNSKGTGDHWYLLVRILLIGGMLGSIPYTFKLLTKYRDKFIPPSQEISEERNARPSDNNQAPRPAPIPHDTKRPDAPSLQPLELGRLQNATDGRHDQP